jgi:hypothetical protein
LRIPWAPIWLAISSAARTGAFYYYIAAADSA